MAQHFVGFLMLVLCSILVQALPRPTVTRNNEETTPISLDLIETESNVNNKNEKSLMYEEGPQGNTKDIVDRIKAINDAISIKKPTKRPQINWNTEPQTGGGYIMDKDVLAKLQEIIASGKLHSYSDNQAQEDNLITENSDLRYSRQMAMMQGNQGLPVMAIPYIVSVPVPVMPHNINGYNNLLSSQHLSPLTRQGTQLSTLFEGFGNIPFPTFGSWFPILIKDPILSIINGGGWSNFIQTGQEADVCRKQKSTDTEKPKVDHHDDITDGNEINNNLFQDQGYNSINMRQGRAIKKRTVLHETRMQEVDDEKKSKKIYSTKATTTRKPAKRVQAEQDTKTVNSHEGDLRFGEFSIFGNKKPVAPSPGFFINRMKVRRGGVAIAGPGGVATAGRGGTAIVGPGGLAYTQPGGLAVAGPHARVIALSHDADLHSIISRLQEQKGSVPRSLQAIPEGKVVATGPVIYYHPNP